MPDLIKMSSIKKLLKRFVRFLPTINLPFGIFTIREITTLKVASNGEFEEVFPGEVIKRSPPITSDERVHFKFREGAPGITKRSNPTYCALLKNAGVIGVSGAVIDSANKLIGDISVELGKSIEQHALLQTIQFRKPLKIEGKSTLIAAPVAASNYFHWMIDALPRFAIVAESGLLNGESINVIVSGNHQVYQLESLRKLGLDREKIISLEEHPFVKCKELITPSLTCLSGNMPYWTIDFLQKTFSDWLRPIEEMPKRIFVSRAKASSRRLINEEVVKGYLLEHNFVTVCLEGKSLKEQVELFFNADEIVGIHGAGFTNLVFAKQGTNVIEFFPSTYVNQCYWTIASHCNLNYAYLLGEGDDTTDETKHLIDADFAIAIDKLHSLRIKVQAAL